MQPDPKTRTGLDFLSSCTFTSACQESLANEDFLFVLSHHLTDKCTQAHPSERKENNCLDQGENAYKFQKRTEGSPAMSQQGYKKNKI